MSDWTRITQDIAGEHFGPMVNLRFRRDSRSCVAYLESDRHVVAIAAGEDHGVACRKLIQVMTRADDMTLTTIEVAEVLGVTDSRVRQLVMEKKLIPATPGGPWGVSSTFSPTDVFGLLPADRE